MPVFVDGDELYCSFPTTEGLLGVLADVRISGSTLELIEPAVFAGDGTRIHPGVRQMLQIARQIEALAKLEGLTNLNLTGQRLTGATPGRMVHVERRIR